MWKAGSSEQVGANRARGEEEALDGQPAVSALYVKGSDSPMNASWAIFLLIHRVEEIWINRWAKCAQGLNKSQLQNIFVP